MAQHATELIVVLCAQFHSCEYGYIRSVHVNNAVNIALSHYSYFCLLIGGGQSTWLLSTVDSPVDSGLSTRLWTVWRTVWRTPWLCGISTHGCTSTGFMLIAGDAVGGACGCCDGMRQLALLLSTQPAHAQNRVAAWTGRRHCCGHWEAQSHAQIALWLSERSSRRVSCAQDPHASGYFRYDDCPMQNAPGSGASIQCCLFRAHTTRT